MNDRSTVAEPAGEDARPSGPNESERGIVLAWWRSTIADTRAPAGPRAELRRARTLEEVVFCPAFHDLRRRLAGTRWRSVDRVALVAGVLARLREHQHGEKGFAGQMAAPPPGGRKRPRVAPSRFRRLLRIGDVELEDLFQQVRRVLPLLDQTADVENLAESLYWWNADTRKRWALAYYEKVDEHALKTE